MRAKPPLADYAAKRSFTSTPEPPPAAATARAGPLLFVVQMHRARALHYDLRFEAEGVLKSFAIPKGPLVQVGQKHLAVPTEDHPLDYGAFEGVIPPGQYGAGQVIVWDCGWYAPDEPQPPELDRAAAEARVLRGLAEGKLSVTFFGVKLKGSYALVRTKDKTWLILKHRDPRPIRPAPAETLTRSVLTGRTVEHLAAVGTRANVALEDLAPNGPSERSLPKLKPMLAQAAPAPFRDDKWQFEPKLDGYRVIATITENSVTLRSRGGQDYTATFPSITAALATQPVKPLILDGELVAFENGLPSFGALQRRAQARIAADIIAAERATPCVFFAFDVLHAHGRNLRGGRYADRRRWLTQLVTPGDAVQLVHAEPDGEQLYRAALAAGFEGVMGKRLAGPYKPGDRSADWLKVKSVQSAEFVVGGYTRGKGARRDRFGALLLGFYENGRLRYAGDVGSGFDEATLAELGPALASLAVKQSPFDPPPAVPGVTWVKPERVIEVRFTEWTDSDQLRAPVFLRVRDDRDPHSVGEPRSASTRAPAVEAESAYIAQQLTRLKQSGTLDLSGIRLRVTHLDKVLWPATATTAAVTKRDLLAYYLVAGPIMLEHLRDRPLTVIRMPEGIGGESFYQRHWDALPEFVARLDGGPVVRHILCDNLATLVYLGQMGVLELHPWHARANADGMPPAIAANAKLEDQLLRPDYIVFDLDPDKRIARPERGIDPAFALARDVAFHLKSIIEAMGLVPFVKTTGHRGLHVFVPVERTLEADAVRDVCGVIGQHLLRAHPKKVTMEHTPDRRPPGRVFFDHNMNTRGRTLAAAYSPRATPGAPLSFPLGWDALAAIDPAELRIGDAARALAAYGAPWRGMLAARRNLAQILA